MSTTAVNSGNKFKKAFTEWDKDKLRRVLLVIFILEAILFGYFYAKKMDLMTTIEQPLPLENKPGLLFNIYGTEQEPLKKPMGVIEMNHKIYVADTDNHRIQVFDYDGKPLQIIGKEGSDKGQFQFPYGLAKDANNQLYVADITNNNISVLSEDGQFLKYFGNNKDLKKPAGLYVDQDQNLVYVADIGLNKIVVLDMNGNKVREFGEPGTGPGQLRSPNAVTLYKGKIYVSDSGNDRVQIFNQLGQYVGLLDGAQTPGGQSNLLAPRGVAVDARGTVFVVNNMINTVVGYDQDNKHLWTLGKMGNDVDAFYLPVGIWIDGQGRVYVTDTVNQRVDVYQN